MDEVSTKENFGIASQAAGIVVRSDVTLYHLSFVHTTHIISAQYNIWTTCLLSPFLYSSPSLL